jgi:hypothetical protein
MMEAVSTSETSINFYKTAWRNNPEGCHIHVLLVIKPTVWHAMETKLPQETDYECHAEVYTTYLRKYDKVID